MPQSRFLTAPHRWAESCLIIPQVIMPRATQITLSIESPHQRPPGVPCRHSMASMGNSQSRISNFNNNNSNRSLLPRSPLPRSSQCTITELPFPRLPPQASGLAYPILYAWEEHQPPAGPFQPPLRPPQEPPRRTFCVRCINRGSSLSCINLSNLSCINLNNLSCKVRCCRIIIAPRPNLQLLVMVKSTWPLRPSRGCSQLINNSLTLRSFSSSSSRGRCRLNQSNRCSMQISNSSSSRRTNSYNINPIGWALRRSNTSNRRSKCRCSREYPPPNHSSNSIAPLNCLSSHPHSKPRPNRRSSDFT